jgi:alpha-glucosidase
MVNFHGANKPTGEPRTWPHELTREAVKGMEYRKVVDRARHDATLPFTRLLAGHADTTPVHFGERRAGTTFAHQIASAALLTSPLLTYAAHPQALLENPAAPIVKSLPAVWDETVVLPVSEIGEIAAFARRSDKTWFLAILNGPTGRTVQIPLTFLGPGEHLALLIRDDLGESAAMRIEERTVGTGDLLDIALREGGGFIARFSPSGDPVGQSAT